MEGIPWFTIGGAGMGWSLAGLAAWSIITGRLVPSSLLERSDARVAKLEGLLDQSIGVTDRVTKAAEVTNDVLTRLPDPAREG